jgi:aldehyde:ferredoxin oxidoreductase
MPYGWTGQLLRVDLTSGTAVKEPLNMEWARAYIGGRGLGTRYLYEEIDPTCDPLGPENKVIFATGPLTGTYAPTGGRYMVLCKSPLTDAIACSNSGGYWGPELKFAGYDMMILEGRAPNPVYVWINDGDVEVRDAAHVWGKNTEETEDLLRAETDPMARIAGIGPAGENLNRTACVINDKSRAAGRSGVGAAMGAKNCKAIAVRGTGAVQCADPLEFGRLVFEAMQAINASPTTSAALRGMGTASTVGFTNSVGILPTNNFQKGQFEHANAISGQTIASTVLKRNKGCYSCPIGCARVTETLPGSKYQGRGEGPEYETIFGLGSDCGVGELDAVLYANYLCNLYALDTISAGGTIATAMELAERGYIPSEDLADVGTDVKFGNADAVMRLLEMQTYRTGPFGNLLAEGGYRLAEHYGHPELFQGSKKQDFAAYDARGAQGMGLGYATSNRGACHLRGYSMTVEWFAPPDQRVDPFDPKGKGMVQKQMQDKAAAEDAVGVCTFASFGATQPETLAPMYNACTGENLSVEEWMTAGDRIWNLERLFNNRAGLSRKDDSLPPRMTREPLTNGAVHNQVVHLEEMLREYYEVRGWDSDGNPTAETLARLGID